MGSKIWKHKKVADDKDAWSCGLNWEHFMPRLQPVASDAIQWAVQQGILKEGEDPEVSLLASENTGGSFDIGSEREH